MSEYSGLSISDIFKVSSDNKADPVLTDNENQLKLSYTENECSSSSLAYKKCDSLFSTCCGMCKRRKLRDAGILVPAPVFNDGINLRASAPDSECSRVGQKTDGSRTSTHGSWDMWQGKTIESDVCKTQNVDKSNNSLMFHHIHSYGYLPHRKQKEHLHFSQTGFERFVQCRVPLYRRTCESSNYHHGLPVNFKSVGR